MTKYYEIKKPSYAVLKAENLDECLNIYTKIYRGGELENVELRSFISTVREVTELEARELISEAYYEMIEGLAFGQ